MRLLLPSVVASAIIAVAVWMTLDTSSSEQVLPEQVQPQVEGRIMHAAEVFGRDMIAFCEYDAWVLLNGATVQKVVREGERSEVRPGDTIVMSDDSNDTNVPPDFDLESQLENREERSVREVGVYRGGNGSLRAGCAPESWVLIDGVGKSAAEWRAEGKIP